MSESNSTSNAMTFMYIAAGFMFLMLGLSAILGATAYMNVKHEYDMYESGHVWVPRKEGHWEKAK